MQAATTVLSELAIPFEARVVSAHRTPARLVAFAESAADNGIQVIIAGAGGAAHLAGMAASMTHLPVIAVPVATAHRALWGPTRDGVYFSACAWIRQSLLFLYFFKIRVRGVCSKLMPD